MKISVVLPVYNVQHYVKNSLKSILNQTFKQFNVYVVNDCSEDRSAEIINFFSDPRVHLINNKHNLGLAESRNIGLAKADGDLIYFMDSDDQIRPNLFQEVVKIFEKNLQLDLLSFNSSKVTSQIEIDRLRNTELLSIKNVSSDQAVRRLMKGQIGTTAWSYFTRKSFLKRVNLHFPSGMLFEDMSTTSYLLSKAHQIIVADYSPTPYLYLQRSNSIMGGNDKHPSEKEITDNLMMMISEFHIFKNVLGDNESVDHWLLGLLLYYYEFYYCRLRKRELLTKYYSNIITLSRKSEIQLSLKEKIKIFMVKYPFLFVLKNKLI